MSAILTAAKINIGHTIETIEMDIFNISSSPLGKKIHTIYSLKSNNKSITKDEIIKYVETTI